MTSGGNRYPAKLDLDADTRARRRRITSACRDLALHQRNRPCHVMEHYANNPIEADHGRLKSRLRPMRGLKRLRSAQVICAGHAFIQNIRRGHYELGTEETV